MKSKRKIKIRKPNLFLVGVSRGGTTSWNDYLKQHPDIFMSAEDMPNFFGEFKDAKGKYFNTEKRYLSLFKKVKDEKFIGEFSHLFGSLNAPNQVKKFNPDSKIIIILRSPIDNFIDSINAGKGKYDVAGAVFRFRSLLYHDNLKRWINAFGRDNVHIMLYEDHVKNVKKEYKKVCDFLGIDNTFKPEFKNLNYSAAANYPFFMKIIFYLWNKLPFIIKFKIKNIFGENKKKIQKYYRKMANSKEIKIIMNRYDKKVIQKAFFLKEIEKTEKLINRSLDIWKY